VTDRARGETTKAFVTYPDFMEALVPLASQPVEVAKRNWITRRMLIDPIRNDPEWNGGNYTKQPRSLQAAQVYFSMATSGGNQAIYKAAPTQEKAEPLIDRRLKETRSGDANDIIYRQTTSTSTQQTHAIVLARSGMAPGQSF
jgi:homoserine O-acetyltransferase